MGLCLQCHGHLLESPKGDPQGFPPLATIPKDLLRGPPRLDTPAGNRIPSLLRAAMRSNKRDDPRAISMHPCHRDETQTLMSYPQADHELQDCRDQRREPRLLQLPQNTSPSAKRISLALQLQKHQNTDFSLRYHWNVQLRCPIPKSHVPNNHPLRECLATYVQNSCDCGKDRLHEWHPAQSELLLVQVSGLLEYLLSPET
ncbi:unannotated protein [freshwater metagenome]|uniref:Unannotated protein n=1 Tax=freshwater metagenome TaxID=449393 RepID=A0A6J6DU85_9ZZZZ